MNYCRASFEIVTRIRQMAPLLYIINFRKYGFVWRMKPLSFLQKNCVDLSSISEVRNYITVAPFFWPTLYITSIIIPVSILVYRYQYRYTGIDFFKYRNSGIAKCGRYWRPYSQQVVDIEWTSKQVRMKCISNVLFSLYWLSELSLCLMCIYYIMSTVLYVCCRQAVVNASVCETWSCCWSTSPTVAWMPRSFPLLWFVIVYML